MRKNSLADTFTSHIVAYEKIFEIANWLNIICTLMQNTHSKTNNLPLNFCNAADNR